MLCKSGGGPISCALKLTATAKAPGDDHVAAD
jgi:hypothetical protein